MLIPNPSILAPESKIAYLTIDDSPSEDMRRKLDVLRDRNIQAVWFCRGDFLEKRPEPVLEAIHRGHIIGNHSYNHPRFSDLPPEEAFQQIEQTDKIINALYKWAGTERPAKFFRFPYGDKGDLRYGELMLPLTKDGKNRKDAIQEYLRSLGYTQPFFPGITTAIHRRTGLFDDVDWRWTFDAIEYAIFEETHYRGVDSLEKVFARMQTDFPEEERTLNDPHTDEIILIHDHPQSTALFTPILDALLAKGLSFHPIPLPATKQSSHAEPILSVVLTTYNRKTLLLEALESCLRERDCSLEVVVIDDGSTDGTAAIFPHADARVRYIRQKHAGQDCGKHAVRTSLSSMTMMCASSAHWGRKSATWCSQVRMCRMATGCMRILTVVRPDSDMETIATWI